MISCIEISLFLYRKFPLYLRSSPLTTSGVIGGANRPVPSGTALRHGRTPLWEKASTSYKPASPSHEETESRGHRLHTFGFHRQHLALTTTRGEAVRSRAASGSGPTPGLTRSAVGGHPSALGASGCSEVDPLRAPLQFEDEAGAVGPLGRA